MTMVITSERIIQMRRPAPAAGSKGKNPLFKCDECGRKFFTTRAAERAAFGDEGCPGCGGSDIVEA